jgi:hypothetical protein
LEQRFDYRGSRLALTSWIVTLSLGIFLPIWTVGFARQELAAGRPLWPLVITIPFWIAVGFGIRTILASRNECIVVTANQLVWIDPLGREALRLGLSEITDLTLKTQRGDDTTQTTATIHSRRGNVRFTSQIGSYADLCAVIRERALGQTRTVSAAASPPRRYYQSGPSRGITSKAVVAFCALVGIPLYIAGFHANGIAQFGFCTILLLATLYAESKAYTDVDEKGVRISYPWKAPVYVPAQEIVAVERQDTAAGTSYMIQTRRGSIPLRAQGYGEEMAAHISSLVTKSREAGTLLA